MKITGLIILSILIFQFLQAQNREVKNHFPVPNNSKSGNVMQNKNELSNLNLNTLQFISSKNSNGYIDSVYSSRYITRFCDVLESDSNYYLSGFTHNQLQSSHDTNNICVLTRFKINKDGNIVWSFTDSLMHGDHFTQGSSSIIKTSDGNFVQMGVVYNDYNSPKNWDIKLAVFVKFNSNGDTIWKKLYADTIGMREGDWPMDIIAENDGGFTTVNLTGSASKSSYDSVNNWYYTDTTYVSLIRYDSLGNQKLKKSYFIGGEKVPVMISQILKLNDGSYVVGGLNQFNGTNNFAKYYLFKTDSLFNWQTMKTFSQIDLEGPYMKIQPFADNKFVFAVYKADTPYVNGYPYCYLHLGIMDSLFNIIRDTMFNIKLAQFGTSTSYYISGGFVYGLEISNKNTIVVGTNLRYGGHLMELDSNFQLKWHRWISYYPDFAEEMYKMRKASDGGFLVAGFSKNTGKGWFVKTDSLGFALPDCMDTLYHVGINQAPDSSTIKIKLFPNPTNSKLTLTFKEEQNLFNRQIQIYNIQGQVVKEMRLNKNESEFTIDVSQLTNGLYLGKIIQDNGEILSFKFVKE